MQYSIEDISKIINSIFSSLFSPIDNNLYSILDDIAFISSSIINDSYFSKILGDQTSIGIILICNCLIIGFVLYYAITSLFYYISFNENINPFKFIFRTALCTILMNYSPFICSTLLDLFNIISLAIRNIGETLFNKSICFSTLIQEINSIIYINSSVDLFSLDGLIKAFISIGLLNLVFSYSLRYILIKLLILLSPFAFISLINKKSLFLFSSWIRSLFSLLFIQIVISLVLLLIFSLNLNNINLFSKILLLGSIYSLTKTNRFVQELVGGISSDFNVNLQSFIRR